jgi:hypothetical protein
VPVPKGVVAFGKGYGGLLVGTPGPVPVPIIPELRGTEVLSEQPGHLEDRPGVAVRITVSEDEGSGLLGSPVPPVGPNSEVVELPNGKGGRLV